MKNLHFALAVVSLLLCGVAIAQGPSDRAVIYYEGWDALTRARLSPEDVRRTAPIVVTIRDPMQVSKVRHWLEVLAMKTRDPEPEDARLVVDFLDGDQKRDSYYASYFNLLSEDSKRGRAIDETFRNHFRFLEER
ncbi:MAG: hypothetical protein ACHQ9S_15340 [Candidatus Binatia bacterium]